MQKKQYVALDNEKLINESLKEIENNKTAISSLVMKMVYLENDMDILEPIKQEIKKLKDKNLALEKLIENLKSQNEEIVDTHETLDEILSKLDNFHKFYDYIESFEEKQQLVRSLVKFITLSLIHISEPTRPY